MKDLGRGARTFAGKMRFFAGGLRMKPITMGDLVRGSGRAGDGEVRMNTGDERTLSGLVEDLHAARLSRRSFVGRAAQMGLTIPVASALARATTREGLAAPK